MRGGSPAGRSKNAPSVVGRGTEELATVTTSRAEGPRLLKQAGWGMDIRSQDGRAARRCGESFSLPRTERILFMKR